MRRDTKIMQTASTAARTAGGARFIRFSEDISPRRNLFNAYYYHNIVMSISIYMSH
jgi:hypothetical protein